MEHHVHVSDAWHVPLGEITVEYCRIIEHRRHVGDFGHIPLPDRSFRTVETFALWRQFEAFVDSDYKLYTRLWREGCGGRNKCLGRRVLGLGIDYCALRTHHRRGVQERCRQRVLFAENVKSYGPCTVT